MKRVARTPYLFGLALVLAVAVAVAVGLGGLGATHLSTVGAVTVNNSAKTTTPIKHVVVIYDENESFDHYFGTYPYAENTDGTSFCPAPGTAGLPGASDSVNTELAAGLVPASTLGSQVTRGNCSTYQGASTPNPEASAAPPVANTTTPNPNEYQPQRIPDTAAVTCDNNHSYTPEEEATDGGRMDRFVQYTSSSCTIPGASDSSPGIGMDYYDGNAVSGLWNYAQHYAMSDNSWDATFGPTMIGSLNMFAGTTYSSLTNSTYISNTNPEWDDVDGQSGAMGGDNIGTLLNAKNVSWGWFEEGFSTPTTSVTNVKGSSANMFSSIYDTPDWWEATSNADHTPPASASEIGFAGAANHQYDTPDFTNALNGTGGASLPAVSFLRADEVRTGHPSVSDPLDEQRWIIDNVNAIEQSAYWPSTAIVIEYDDSDGYYDHQAPTILNSSNTGNDSAICSNAAAAGVPALGGQSNRCGPSQRLPFAVISPYAKTNFVDHALVTQDSTLKFIEQNWGLRTIGPATFDNLAQLDNLDSFFDFSHPQQNEVLLDGTCNVRGLGVVSNTCNNTTANALAGDGVVDAGTTTDAGFGAVQSTPAVTVPAPPTETVANTTVTVPAAPTGTLSSSALLNDVDATISQGTLTADTSAVNLQVPGTYTATVSGTYEYTSTGVSGNSVVNDIDSANPQSVTVNVVPTVSVAKAALTYVASSPPTAQQILDDAGASINSGTLTAPDLSAVDLSTPGTYAVSITGAKNGQQATPVTVAITVIPTPAITLANATVQYQAGQSPTPAQVLADAGATINTGALDAPDLSGVNFTTAGSYTVTITGSSAGYDARPATLTVQITGSTGGGGAAAPKITLAKAAVAYLAGSSPSSAQVLGDAGAQTTAGSLAVDLSSVDFSTPGVYPVPVTGSDDGTAAIPVELAVDVVSQPAVTLGSPKISTLQGVALSSDQVLADAGAGVSGGGTLAPVDLSGVDFNLAGTYTVKVGGAVSGLAATPATVTITVIAPPVVTVAHSSLSYPSGSSVSSADLLTAAGAAISGQGTASIDLSGVDFSTPGVYAAQVVGSANGIAAAPVVVDITVRPVISLAHATVKVAGGAKLTAASVLKAAGAKISSGSLAAPNLKRVVTTAAGSYTVELDGTANGVSATAVPLTIVVNPKLTVAHRTVKIARGTHVTAKLLTKKLGITLRDGGSEKLKLSFGKVKPRKRGTYPVTVSVVGAHGATVTSVTVHVTVTR